MNKISRFSKLMTSAAMAVLSSGVLLLAPMKASALSIPYTGDTTPPAPYPAFNVFTGTPNEGDEHDFLRGKVKGDPNPSVNDVQTACEDGTTFTLRVYVHNGASQYQNGNGDGPSVAHGVTVKVGGVSGTATAFTPNATISASNAASVSDDMHITCTNGAQVTMSYVKGTAQQYTGGHGYQPLSDNIVTTGAPIGTNGPDGNVWGCWEQRVWVTLDVKVTKVAPPTSAGQCQVVDVQTTDVRKVKVTITGTATNAQIVGYQINWGDNTAVSNQQTDTHTYAQDGTYTIVTKVQVKFADGHTEWVGADSCNKPVTFATTVNKVTPPTTLVNTGPGDVAGIFAATTIGGAAAYSVFTKRRLSRQ